VTKKQGTLGGIHPVAAKSSEVPGEQEQDFARTTEKARGGWGRPSAKKEARLTGQNGRNRQQGGGLKKKWENQNRFFASKKFKAAIDHREQKKTRLVDPVIRKPVHAKREAKHKEK